VRAGDGKERAAGDLLPEIEAGLVPVLGRVGEIVLDDGPDDALGRALVAVGDQPLGVLDESDGAQGRAVPLRATPFASEGSEVDIELGLTETRAVGEGSRGVRDLLQLGLRRDVVLDDGLQGGVVVVAKGLDDAGEDQGGIAGPGEEVWVWRLAETLFHLKPVSWVHSMPPRTRRVRPGRAGNHNAGGGTGSGFAVRADVGEQLVPCDGLLGVDEGINGSAFLETRRAVRPPEGRLDGRAQDEELGEGMHGGQDEVGGGDRWEGEQLSLELLNHKSEHDGRGDVVLIYMLVLLCSRCYPLMDSSLSLSSWTLLRTP
jgi:hypothetical protein